MTLSPEILDFENKHEATLLNRAKVYNLILRF